MEERVTGSTVTPDNRDLEFNVDTGRGIPDSETLRKKEVSTQSRSKTKCPSLNVGIRTGTRFDDFSRSLSLRSQNTF